MLNTLFKMENIKYVISVDDCFAPPEEEQLREELYIDSIASFVTVKPFFIKFGKEEQVNDIQDMLDLGADASINIQSLINCLKREELEECLLMLHPDKCKLSDEKQGILEFLNKLADNDIIEDYLTLSSTHEAEAFDSMAHGMNDGAILWLIDKSFLNANESATAGIELAKNKIKQPQISDNFVFMLTTINSTSDKEEDIEAEFDNMLAENDTDNASFIYFINKNLVMTQKYDRIARSLAFGFKRKQCYKLMDVYTDCLRSSCDKAVERLRNIDQNTLNYVFTKKVQAKGESYFDFFDRLVQIFHEEEYGHLLSTKRMDISNNINHYQNLCDDIPQEIGNLTDVKKVLAEVRKKELYDMYVNQKHSEISTGDVFKIKNDYYILVTQPCDTYLRNDGKRKLDKAILLKIVQNPGTPYKYELSCFCDTEGSFKNTAVIFQDNIIIPFEVLDLCVANKDGKACINTDYFDNDVPLGICFTSNYKKRYEIITKIFSKVYRNKHILDKLLDYHTSEEDVVEAKDAYVYLLKSDSDIKAFEINGTSMMYPVQRVSRLNELHTVGLLNEYGHILSRVGQPFDFLKDDEFLQSNN